MSANYMNYGEEVKRGKEIWLREKEVVNEIKRVFLFYLNLRAKHKPLFLLCLFIS
jgi:hypothetical protein